MSTFFREKSTTGIGGLVGAREELRVGGVTVAVKERLAEGGFGYVDLVADNSHRDLVVIISAQNDIEMSQCVNISLYHS